MRTVEFHRYWLPAGPGRKSPHLSSWKMDANQAAALGALRPEPSTREVREIPDTPEETTRAMAHYPSAGVDGARPPRKD